MEQWTDKAIKQHIEDLIEESYILSLSDHEMREYFRDFIGACEHILNAHLSIHDDLKTVRIKMALLKARLLVDQKSFMFLREGTEDPVGANHDRFASRIVTAKRSILQFFEILDQNVQEVLDEVERRKILRMKEKRRRKIMEKSLVSTGYYLLLAGVIALILYVGFH